MGKKTMPSRRAQKQNQYNKRKTVQQTEDRVRNIDYLMKQLNDESDSESESECEVNDQQSKIAKLFDSRLTLSFDENNKPTVVVEKKDGSIRRVDFYHTRDKYYHEDVFPGITAPNNFDNKAVRKMPYSDKLKYLRTTIPDEKVFELQNEIGKMLLEPENISVPGFLGKNKIEGIFDIDASSRIVSFTTSGTDKHRTIVKMSPKQMNKLVKRDFHLYPDK